MTHTQVYGRKHRISKCPKADKPKKLGNSPGKIRTEENKEGFLKYFSKE